MATSVSNPTTASSLQLFSLPARALRPACAGGLRVARALVFPPAARRARWQPRPGPATGGRPVLRCGAVGTVGQQEFASEVLGSDLPVLVEFVAGWCGPCRLITPVVDWASQFPKNMFQNTPVVEGAVSLHPDSFKEYEGKLKVVKIDHDANPKLIEKYKVYGLPTIILFKEGQEVPGSRREGAITKVKLKEYLNSVLESTTTVG